MTTQPESRRGRRAGDLSAIADPGQPAQLVHPDARLVDAGSGEVLTSTSLRAQIDRAGALSVGAPRGVHLALMPTTLPAVVAYLAALAVGRPIALLDPHIRPEHLRAIMARFAPALVTGATGPVPDGYELDAPLVWRRSTSVEHPPPHPELGLLLATSGSTGSPKLVRLSKAAVLASADAIVSALGIDRDEVAVTALPLHHALGLSVLNSHLRAGATVVVERSAIFQRDFWSTVDRHSVTTVTAVPYQLEMLRRLGFATARHARVRSLATSGGRLRPELALELHAAMTGRLFVMYGATEATARMTVLPPDRLPAKLGSVGLPVPGGSVEISPTGEIIYSGPSVMMGYAQKAGDLARGDEFGGTLATGDLGHLDRDGFLYLEGRLNRLAKIFGVRVDLDDIEGLLPEYGPLAAVAGDDRVVVLLERALPSRCEVVRAELSARMGMHSLGFDVRAIDTLPLLPNGKVDYQVLVRSNP